jgi:hypothetical protein
VTWGQRWVLAIALAASAALILYPPWTYDYLTKSSIQIVNPIENTLRLRAGMEPKPPSKPESESSLVSFFRRAPLWDPPHQIQHDSNWVDSSAKHDLGTTVYLSRSEYTTDPHIVWDKLAPWWGVICLVGLAAFLVAGRRGG